MHALLALSLLFACDNTLDGLARDLEQLEEHARPTPPPPELATLVGTWSDGTTTMVFSESGQFSHRKKAGGSKTMNVQFTAPVQTWSEGHFVAGIGPVGQTFTIDALPAEVDGTWTVTINGHVLTRQTP